MFDLNEGWICYPEGNSEAATLHDNLRPAFHEPEEAIRDAVAFYGPRYGRLLISDRLMAEPDLSWTNTIPEQIRAAAITQHGRVLVGQWLASLDAYEREELAEGLRQALVEWMDSTGVLPDWYELTDTRQVTDDEIRKALADMNTVLAKP